jgi:PST family polysaccharide transporter
MSHVPAVLIGSVLGPVALGYYVVGSKLVEFMVQILIAPVHAVGMPAVARVQSEPHRVQELVTSTVGSLCIISFPAFLGLLAVAPVAVPLFFGDQWAPSVPILRTLCILGLVQSVSVLFDSVLQGTGRPNWLVLIFAIHSVPKVIMIIVLMPLGIEAVVLGMVALQICLTPVDILIIRKTTGINFLTALRHVLPTLAVAVAMAAGAEFWIRQASVIMPGPLALGTSVLLGALIYGCLAMLVNPTLVRGFLAGLRSLAQREPAEAP